MNRNVALAIAAEIPVNALILLCASWLHILWQALAVYTAIAAVIAAAVLIVRAIAKRSHGGITPGGAR